MPTSPAGLSECTATIGAEVCASARCDEKTNLCGAPPAGGAPDASAASFAEPFRRILEPWPVLPGAMGLLQTPLVRLRDGLRRAAAAASRPGIPGSIAVTLAALVLAIGVWLVAS